ncbi:hemerythrin domain-containing protein [Streptomyces sp. NPDC056982]|uniref:hemerythrin domain-containing protein n=1 Tax=Streptomyces sp. NPDC056982 TaxID=3345986 RepID=UPI003625ACA5
MAELAVDHREVDELFIRIEAQPARDTRRRELVDELTVELVRHSVAEDQYLYPAVREHVDDSAALADKELEDHAEAERLLKDLEGRDGDDDQFDTLLAKLKSEVTEHIRDEEARLFPLLAAACTPQELEELGDELRKAKKAAPTRPHPSVPTTPPGNKILGPGVGLVDRARDLLTGRKH